MKKPFLLLAILLFGCGGGDGGSGGGNDTTPNQFTFTDISDASLSTQYTSNAITVTGINAATTISISGNSGEYRINSGSWTAASGTVSFNDTVTIRQTSSSINSTSVNTTLTIGGVSDTYTVTTVSRPVSVEWSNGFESNDFSGWDGYSQTQGGRFYVTNTGSYAGTYSAYGTTSTGQTTDYYLEQPFGDHPRSSKPVDVSNGVYIKMAVKYGTGYQAGDTDNWNKVFLLNAEDSLDRRRSQVIVNTAVISGDTRGRYIIENIRWNVDGSFNTGQVLPQNQGVLVTYTPGGWDIVKLYVKNNTVGSANGIVRLWVNGGLKAEYTGLILRLEGSNSNMLIIGSYTTSTDLSGSRGWDSVSISSSDPD